MSENSRPREIRAWHPGYELRAAADGGMPTLFGHFAVFNRWAEIDSWFEGNFLERLAPGSLKKTFQENRSRIRALFHHGQDPQVGDKPLGAIAELREDETGGYYEVPLLDTAYNREILPGLEAGVYGASFRFEVMREDFPDEAPEPSEENPKGLRERTLKEIRLFEFGPTPFPAYADASADVRSLTDWFLFEQIARDPRRARELVALGTHEFVHKDEAPSTTDAVPELSAYRAGTREIRDASRLPVDDPKHTSAEPERREPKFRSREEFLAWIANS
jgi:HK97 family phage prohead protease